MGCAPDAESWLIWKDPDAGKDWEQEERGTTEDEMVGWHHRHNGPGFGWTLGVGDGQGGLACCSSWGRKELDTTERLNWTELNWTDRWMEDLAKVLLSGKWAVLLGGDLGAESVGGIRHEKSWGAEKKDWEKEELSVSWVTSDTLPEDREILTFSSTLHCLFSPCPLHPSEKSLLNFIFYHISFFKKLKRSWFIIF